MEIDCLGKKQRDNQERADDGRLDGERDTGLRGAFAARKGVFLKDRGGEDAGFGAQNRRRGGERPTRL